MPFKDNVQSLFDGIDLIAARLRQPMRAIFGVFITLQVVYAAGGLEGLVPPGSKWAKWVAVGGAVIAYYTQRRGEPLALREAKKVEAAQDAAVRP